MLASGPHVARFTTQRAPTVRLRSLRVRPRPLVLGIQAGRLGSFGSWAPGKLALACASATEGPIAFESLALAAAAAAPAAEAAIAATVGSSPGYGSA